MKDVPPEYTARWSAGANILAFLPTIVGLMSNSIDEVMSVADDSIFLAFALSLSSVSAFNSRFGDRKSRDYETLFDEHKLSSAAMQTACARIQRLLDESRVPRPWWRNGKLQSWALAFVAIAIAAGVWYEVYQITVYGIVVFACPVKANLGICVGLSQLLALLNVVCRKVAFDVHTIRVGDRGRSRAGRQEAASASSIAKICKVRIRCPRNTMARRLFTIFNGIASFTLYAYGTVVLASTTLVPASDAIRAMVVAAVSAGFGRLAGHYLTSSFRQGCRTIAVEVPASCLGDFKAALLRDSRGIL